MKKSEVPISTKIYEARMGAGLTQEELAEECGTTGSVISRLESLNYNGHSLSMLRKIAKALNKRVVIEFVPLHKDKKEGRK